MEEAWHLVKKMGNKEGSVWLHVNTETGKYACTYRTWGSSQPVAIMDAKDSILDAVAFALIRLKSASARLEMDMHKSRHHHT